MEKATGLPGSPVRIGVDVTAKLDKTLRDTFLVLDSFCHEKGTHDKDFSCVLPSIHDGKRYLMKVTFEEF